MMQATKRIAALAAAAVCAAAVAAPAGAGEPTVADVYSALNPRAFTEIGQGVCVFSTITPDNTADRRLYP